MKLIFLDTETTGHGDEDRLCQVAYKVEGENPVSGLFKPPLPISLEAMAVTHITNKMVADKPVFQGSPICDSLKRLFETGAILVAHNAEFDRKMLVREGIDISPEQTICTMKVARHTDVEDKIQNYKMQYIRYFMELEIDANPHDAADDIRVLEAIYCKLREKLTIEEMMKVTRDPFLLRRITFGKHKDKPFYTIPKDYLGWLVRQENVEGDLLYTLQYYLERKVV